MENENNDRSASVRRLTLSRENFDDYLVALMAKLRSNPLADQILSGELAHPLVNFQQINVASLQTLNVPWVAPASLLADPVTPYINWLRRLTDALINAPAPVPDIEGLQALQVAQTAYRAAERHIYSTIVTTLKIGESMHYARQCTFGAGQVLLQTIVNDNRQTTTRSLMAIFSALVCLQMKDNENFDQFERRINLLIQRLRSWRPPVILPGQLLLFCVL